MVARIVLLMIGVACVIALIQTTIHPTPHPQPTLPAPTVAATPPAEPTISNPAIDMPGYLQVSVEAAAYRERHRVSEAEFIRLSQEPGTIVLDARSAQKYATLHIKGAVNLSFPDITVQSLQQTLPDHNTRILIYCNNNFENAPEPFPSKRANASLNLSTYIALYSYGYRNVYELGPLLDINASRLTFASGTAP